VKRLFRKKREAAALRYELKKALYRLGPTGYPFEHFIGELFSRQGYETEVGCIVQGACVSHEIDVIATGDDVQYLVECKYTRSQGKRVNVQTPLYLHSRVEDISEKRKELPQYESLRFTAALITNARFSSDTITYGECKGIALLAWDYPVDAGLKDMIQRFNIFPITILTQLTRSQKLLLMKGGIVTCAQLLNDTRILQEFHMSEKREHRVIREAESITRSE
jgi:hypothetical protein